MTEAIDRYTVIIMHWVGVWVPSGCLHAWHWHHLVQVACVRAPRGLSQHAVVAKRHRWAGKVCVGSVGCQRTAHSAPSYYSRDGQPHHLKENATTQKNCIGTHVCDVEVVYPVCRAV